MPSEPLPSPLLEVIVLSADDARQAEAAGADRIEVVSSIECGGLTPAAEVVQAIARQVGCPQMVMLRPHARSFVYDDADMRSVSESVAMARDAGAQGLVFGALTADGEIDIARLEQVLRWADGLPVTFHRAFDSAADLPRAARVLSRYRGLIAQLLTSGGQPTATEGRDMLRDLVRLWRQGVGIEPLIGSGVGPDTLAALREHTGARQFHVGSGARQGGRFGGPIDATRVQRLRELLSA